MKKVKSIYFVGIKGVGMMPLALMAKQAGIKVSGSDVPDVFITDDALVNEKITVYSGFSADHVGDTDLVITTGAHGGFDNVEVVEAKKKNIPVMTQGEAVGAFMAGAILGRNNLQGISVIGSHGKTTTTGLIATVLTVNHLDPSYIIGTSTIPSLGNSGHYGKGNYFVAEADEYATEPTHDKTPKLLWQKPKIVVCTNIELDHTDLYSSDIDIRDVFSKFVNKLPMDGLFVAYGNDPLIQHILKGYEGKKITYGITQNNDYVVTHTYDSEDLTFFRLSHRGNDLGEFSILLAGEHNVLNAVAAIIVALECGLSLENAKKGILAYTGAKRRFEYLGSLPSGALLYDDYAHHPTEIAKTLTAFSKRFPTKRLICIFQPHTYSRTKALFADFSRAFTAVDEVILTDIYASLRESTDTSVSSELLADEVKKYQPNVKFLPKLQDVIQYVDNSRFDDQTVVITMGAGDVYKIAESLLQV